MTTRAALSLLGALGCTAALAAPSVSAATLTITSGPDPVESIATQVGVTGTLETSNQYVYLTVKPAGGTGCAANPNADNGSQAIASRPGIGPYSRTVNWTFAHAGAYLLCGWVTDGAQDGNPAIASTSQTIAVRVPHLSLSVGAPAQVLRGRTFQVTITAQTEASRDVHVYRLRDTGRACPANSDAANASTGVEVLFGASVLGGPSTETRNERLMVTGRYLICGYVDYSGEVAPEATASATVDVLAPCIVPHLRRGTTLRRAKARIVAAHCTVGKVTYAHSLTRARGRVISLSPRPGSGHAPNAPVAIAVSSGPPRHRHHR